MSLLDRIDPSAREEPPAETARAPVTDLISIEGYELLEEIGRGGTAVVYKAVQLSTKRVVALVLVALFTGLRSRQ